MVTVAAAVQLLSKLMVVLWVLGPTAPQWLVLAALVPPEVLGPLALKTWQVAQLYQLCPCTLQLSLCSLSLLSSPPPPCALFSCLLCSVSHLPDPIPPLCVLLGCLWWLSPPLLPSLLSRLYVTSSPCCRSDDDQK